MKQIASLLPLLIFSVGIFGQTNTIQDNNILTNKEAKRGWQLLFDGNTLNGWKGYNSDKVFDCWSVANGELVCKGEGGSETAGDIITASEFGDFELSIEWSICKAGNSGIFYHVVENAQYHAAYETGPEYQVIDDLGWPGGLADWQKTAADYAMYPAKSNKKLMPIGEWNQTRIVYKKQHVEYWLNGTKVVEFEAYSPEWKKKKDEGKWKDFPGYAVSDKGHIGLQNHGSGVKFRNIKIRKLD
jgi:hypothetical protein